MKKVTKSTIKKLIRENGEAKFYLLPCKVGIGSMWIKPMDFKVNSLDELESKIAEFEYYNCNGELGKYANYYI